jgi:hypothetical protein
MDKSTKISRRDIIGKLVAVSTAIGAFVKLRARAQAAPTPQATPTIDQKTADYVSHPVFGNECSWCIHFVSPSSCQIVEGTISPHGHCRFFSTTVP